MFGKMASGPVRNGTLRLFCLQLGLGLGLGRQPGAAALLPRPRRPRLGRMPRVLGRGPVLLWRIQDQNQNHRETMSNWNCHRLVCVLAFRHRGLELVDLFEEPSANKNVTYLVYSFDQNEFATHFVVIYMAGQASQIHNSRVVLTSGVSVRPDRSRPGHGLAM
jgi:hypothetical protein